MGTNGAQVETSVAEFGNDLNCAYYVPTGGADPRKNAGPPPEPCCAPGNPINAGTGNKYQVEVDFAKVNGLEFVRTYNSSLNSERTALGLKWRHNWDRRIFATSNFAQAIRGDGKAYQFAPPASGSTRVAPADVAERLEAISGGWKLTTAAEEVEIYDSDGRLLSVLSPEGQVTTLSCTDGTSSGSNGAVYEDLTTVAIPAGRLLSVTDFRGRSLEFRYKSDDTLRKLIDPAGEGRPTIPWARSPESIPASSMR